MASKKIIIISGDTLGAGSEELGRKLMGSFLRKLWALDNKPAKILFYNAGVKLMAKGSPTLEALDGLDQAGVDLVACGTCVSFFDLKDKMVVGRIGDMHEIAGSIIESTDAITE